jgi:Kelch motif
MESVTIVAADDDLRSSGRATWTRDTSWLPLPPMTTKRQECAVVSLGNGCLLISGGLGAWENYLDSVELFDPNSWTRRSYYMPALNQKRAAHVASMVHNTVYVIGGWGGHDCDLSSVEMLDVSPWIIKDGNDNDSDQKIFAIQDENCPQWKVLLDSPMPTARCNMASVVVDDRIYVMGGYGGGQPLNSVEIFDTTTCSWSSGPSMHVPRWPCRAAVVGGIIHVGGGDNSSLETYEPSASSGGGDWCRTETNIFNLMNIRAAAGVGGSLVMMGCDGDSEVWDGTHLRILPRMGVKRNWFASCVLPNGSLVVIGGGPCEGCQSTTPTSSVELFRFLVDPFPTRAEFDAKFNDRKRSYETTRQQYLVDASSKNLEKFKKATEALKEFTHVRESFKSFFFTAEELEARISSILASRKALIDSDNFPEDFTQVNSLQMLLDKYEFELKLERLSLSKVNKPPPHYWSISFEQLLEIRRLSAEKFGEAFPNKTMHDINSQIVRPLCERVNTSYALTSFESKWIALSYICNSLLGRAIRRLCSFH